MKVTNDGCEIYKIEFDTDSLTFIGCETLTDAKNRFIECLSNDFDKAVASNLGISFPFEIGGVTFYSLNELENYIKYSHKAIEFIRNQQEENNDLLYK